MHEHDPCAICTRTPLVGESVLIVEDGGSEAAVCEGCVAKPRAVALGRPVRRERVRSAAGAATVRRAIPAPAPAPAISPRLPARAA